MIVFQSILFFAFLFEATGRYLSEAKDAEINVPKIRDALDEELEATGGDFGFQPPKLDFSPEYQEAHESGGVQQKPKLQPVDESGPLVTDPDQPLEEVQPDAESREEPKIIQTRPECTPRELVEDKSYADESVAKEVSEDSLSPLESTVETSTFSKVTDPNMIEEPFKKIYVRPLCDD